MTMRPPIRGFLLPSLSLITGCAPIYREAASSGDAKSLQALKEPGIE